NSDSEKEILKISITLYSIICTLGIIGNGLVIWIAGFRMKKTVSAVWFLNLAIADFLCCASLSLRIVNGVSVSLWTTIISCILSIFLFLLNISASVLLLTAMSIDRWVSVIWPIWVKINRTRKLVIVTAVCIWCLSALWTVFVFMYHLNHSLNINEWCFNIDRSYYGYPNFQTIILIRLFTMFVIPFLIILTSYVTIFFKLIYSKRPQRSQRPYRIITAVILCFFICWCPYYIWPLTPMYHQIAFEAFLVDLVITTLACLNSCLNPIIYVFMTPDIKQGFFRSIPSRLKRTLNDQPTDLQREF
ncbi:chemerin-like receptor 1, partial [Dendropsophus ebraccatus]|uniref:chemerin-like receptor 1 n=1 Tax=Dendropsophus ebraccatus TaxID=150705 RepID=UPI0038316ED9